MKTPHESHSFGHGQDCFYCGLRDDDSEIESRCDQRVRKHPTEEEMAAYRARTKLGEEIATIAEIEYGLAQSIEWDEMIARIQALCPADSRSDSALLPPASVVSSVQPPRIYEAMGEMTPEKKRLEDIVNRAAAGVLTDAGFDLTAQEKK